MNETQKTALAMLSSGLSPVLIQPGSKRPIGRGWDTRFRTEETIQEVFTKYPEAGIGILLGDRGDGQGVVDFEIDDPSKAQGVIRRIFGEEGPAQTLHFHSTRGTHYLYKYDPRLVWIGDSEVKGDHYEGVELRIGTTDPTRPAAKQSLIPPTPRPGGEPRTFYAPNGGVLSPVEAMTRWDELVSPLPDALFRDIDRFHCHHSEDSKGSPQWGVDDVKAFILGQGPGFVLETVRAWGLRVVGDSPGNADWMPCHAIEREDKDPSAQIDLTTGVYVDFVADRRLSLLSIPVALGIHPNFPSAVNAVGKALNVPPSRSVRKGEPVSPVNSYSLDPWSEPNEVTPPDVLPYPTTIYPDPLAEFIEEASQAIDCPSDYLGVSLIAASGAAIGNSVHLRISETYTQPPHLYAAFIGLPGERKSTVVRVISDPLTKLDQISKCHYQELLDLSEEKDKGNKPLLKQFLVGSDSTKEAISQFLADNPRGGGMAMDEIASLVSNLNAYRGGRGDDRQFFLSVNSGATIKVSRKGNPLPLILRNPCLSLWGALTPSKLPALRGGDTDDGWFDRFILSYPPVRELDEDFSTRAVPERLMSRYVETINRLSGIPCDVLGGDAKPAYLTMTPGAVERYSEWFRLTRREMNAEPSFRGPWSKLEGFCFRFALNLTLMDWGSKSSLPGALPEKVDTEVMDRACSLAEYHKSHSRKVYQELADGISGSDERGRKILATLARGISDGEQGKETELARNLADLSSEYRVITYRLLKRYHRWGKVELDGAIEWLHQSGYLQTLNNRPGGVGRPSNARYAINPLWRWEDIAS